MVGCMIVVVALLCSVLAGFCLDVSKQTRPVTDYEYVTDVTGLFDIDQAPAYIEYSPSTNYTGYADISSMNYSWSAVPNAYRVMLDPGPTLHSSVTYSQLTTTVPTPHFAVVEPPDSILIDMLFEGYADYETGDYTSSQPVNVEINSAVTVQKMLTKMGLTENRTTLTIDMGQSNSFSYSPTLLWHSSGTNPRSFTVDLAGGGNELHQIWTFDTTNAPGEIDTQGWGNSDSAVLGGGDKARLVYTPASDLVEVYRYDKNTDTEKYLFTDRSTNIFFCANYNYDHQGYLVFNGYRNLSTLVIDAEYIGAPVYDYINPADGVALNNGMNTTWSNGYHNNEINMTVSRATVGSNNLTVQVDGATGSNSSIQINTSATGNMNVVVTDATGTSTTKVLGRWDSAQVSIDASAQTVSVTPIVGSPSYTEPVPANGTTITFPNWWTGGDIDSLRLSTSGTSLRFGITDTWVFLDTYQSVMTNPTITIGDYFPELADWRLNFYSFALTGNSLTINGETYSVSGDQTITIGTGDDAVTGSLSNVYVSKIDGEMFFTFADTGQTVDLGSSVSDTITFNGRWYFTTGLYDAVPGIEEYYDWNLDGGWHATSGQLLVVFLGLLALGTIIVKGVMRTPLRATDVFILGFAALVSIILGGIVI